MQLITIHCNIFGLRELAVKNVLIARKRNSNRPFLLFKINNSNLVENGLLIIGITGLIIFGYQLNNIKQPPNVQNNQIVASPKLNSTITLTDTSKPQSMNHSEPTSIIIPNINVNSGVKAVSQAQDGTIETPNVLEEITGWYKYSPTPGEIGPSIIVGHVDNYQGPSVFWRLRELKPGDSIEVLRKDGQVARFKVDSLSQFDQNKFPSDIVYGNISYPGLRLITCGGTFNTSTGYYSENTVVFASIVTK